MNRLLLICRRAWVAAVVFSFCLPARAGNFQLVSARDASREPSATAGGFSGNPIISPDGRYVVFASTAQNLVATSNPPPSTLFLGWLNVYVRDRVNDTTTLVSANLAGVGGNGNSWPSAISTNGQYILFESDASDLVAGDTNNAPDVFIRDLAAGATTLVSVGLGGASANGASRSSVMTPDGRYVAFVSAATNLMANDTNGIADVFVRDLQAQTTALVSAGAKGATATFSESPDITPDGRYVAFYSTATNLMPGATTNGNVYVRDLAASTTTWVSTNAAALFLSLIGTSNTVSCNQVISADGRYVAFEACTNVVNGPFARGVVLRQDLQTGLTTVIHSNANVSLSSFQNLCNLDMTPDGRFIVFVANTNTSATCIELWDAQSAALSVVSAAPDGTVTPGTLADWPTLDAAGQHVVFVSTATNLTADALSGATNDVHLFIRDLSSGTTRLAAWNLNGAGTVVSPASPPSRLSDDGRFIAFESADGNVATNDLNNDFDVFVSDLQSNVTELISVRSPALPSLTPDGYNKLGNASVSTDGRYVAFVSTAQDLAPIDTNGLADVYVRDLLLASNLLVSVSTNGAASDGPSWEPSINGDGRYVAFASRADNLVSGITNQNRNVYLRDLVAGATALVSRSNNSAIPGNFDSFSPTLSTNANYVLFWSKANNLAPGSVGSGSVQNLYLRDLQAATNYVLTASTSATIAQYAAMTPDGHYVIFSGMLAGGSSSAVYVWNAQTAARIYTNNAASPTYVAISPDGGKIAFVATTTTANLYVADLSLHTNWVLQTGSFTGNLGLGFSGDGRFLTYAVSTNSTSKAGGQNVFLYDFQAGTNLLVNQGWAANPGATNPAVLPAISADGRYVAFHTSASNNVYGDLNQVPDVAVYDRSNNATILISLNQWGNSTPNQRSGLAVFSGDGNTLVFQSWASDQLAGDFNQTSDLFAFQFVPPAWAGTNSTNTASIQAGIIPIGSSGQGLDIVWPTTPRLVYHVQFKNNLDDPAWQDLPDNFIIQNGQGIISDTSTNTQRFYRIFVGD